MKKIKEPKIKDMDEFHKLNTKDAQGHLHYVCGKKGNKYESIGITHAKKTRGQQNVPLKKNPNPKDPEKAYVRPKLTEEKKERYGKQLNGLGLDAEDKKKVWALIETLQKEKKTKK